MACLARQRGNKGPLFRYHFIIHRWKVVASRQHGRSYQQCCPTNLPQSPCCAELLVSTQLAHPTAAVGTDTQRAAKAAAAAAARFWTSR